MEYSVAAQVKLAALDDGETGSLSLYKNGAFLLTLHFQMQPGTGTVILQGSAPCLLLSKGDYLEVFAWHDHGSSRTSSDDSDSWFMAAKVA